LDTASTSTDSRSSRVWEVIWAAFALANLIAMFLLADWQTVPFHLIWVSLTLLYGWAFVWSWRRTMTWFAIVTIATGVALTYGVASEPRLSAGQFDELTEIPLMAAMFLASVWHVRQRQRAADEAASLAASRQRLLDREHEFLRDASHGLRTPIQVARGHAELLLRDTKDPSAIEDLAVILDELDRLARISDQLLLLAASEGPGFLRPKPLALNDFLEHTMQRWEPTAPRDWSLRLEWRGEVQADADRLAVAVDAVIENAVKYTDPGDAINITLRADQGLAEISIADEGAGIPASQVDHVFERFSRDTRPPTGRGGTGLGLSIVKAVVDAHGGSISVESEQGEGTTVRVRLPLAARDRTPPDTRATLSAV
jgi:signal transduction histidine kinase